MSLLSLSKKYLARDAQPAKSPKKATKKDTATKSSKAAAEKPAARPPVSVAAARIRLRPMVTEESMRAHAYNTVVFRVIPKATKAQIKHAVTEQFGAKVLAVRTASFGPKTRRRGSTAGSTNAWKKAYVTVDNIQSLIG